MRVVQPAGTRGSLKWIQAAINTRSRPILDNAILSQLGGARTIEWRSPLASDGFAEYRDRSFLRVLGVERHHNELSAFWPRRGPQWDALGLSDAGDLLLVEAKAHLDELCSSPSQAGETSRKKIEAALNETATFVGSTPRAPWLSTFYQLANRIAHLHFLRKRAERAWLVLVNFVDDRDMNGPKTKAEWEAAYRMVWHALGVPPRHALESYIVHVFPDVADLSA
jgi:hypothetical protein